MTVHVLPGDAQLEEFKKTRVDGDVIVCRECFVTGPVDADTRSEFWDQRAKFILAAYGEDEIEYHERVADELEKLSDLGPDDEVNLWFEYELFCSVNLWFCLSLLADSGARVYRVEPAVRAYEERWKGFGSFDAALLEQCFEARKELTPNDLKLGASLWLAFSRTDWRSLKELSASASDRFPYLAEVCEAAAERDLRPAETLIAIKKEGKTDFGDIFAEFSRRAGVYGYGDLQVQDLLDKLS